MNFSQATAMHADDPAPDESPSVVDGVLPETDPPGKPGGHHCFPPQDAAARWGISKEDYLASRWRRQPQPGAERPVRVVVGQPDPSTCAGIAALLASMPGILVVGTASKKFDLFRHVNRLRPDVVVTELMFGSADPCRGLQAAMRSLSGVPMVVLTAHRSDAALLCAVRAGATSFVERRERPVVLEMAIRNAAAQGSYFGINTIERLIRLEPDEPAARAARLTGRQTEIVALVHEGLSAQEIGARLGLRPKTVAAHMDRIRGKIGASPISTARRARRAVVQALSQSA